MEDDEAFLSSYRSVYGYQDDTEISIRAKHELTNDMMKLSLKGKEREIQQI